MRFCVKSKRNSISLSIYIYIFYVVYNIYLYGFNTCSALLLLRFSSTYFGSFLLSREIVLCHFSLHFFFRIFSLSLLLPSNPFVNTHGKIECFVVGAVLTHQGPTNKKEPFIIYTSKTPRLSLTHSIRS